MKILDKVIKLLISGQLLFVSQLEIVCLETNILRANILHKYYARRTGKSYSAKKVLDWGPIEDFEKSVLELKEISNQNL